MNYNKNKLITNLEIKDKLNCVTQLTCVYSSQNKKNTT